LSSIQPTLNHNYQQLDWSSKQPITDNQQKCLIDDQYIQQLTSENQQQHWIDYQYNQQRSTTTNNNV